MSGTEHRSLSDGARRSARYSYLPRPKRQLNSQHGDHMIRAPCPSWLIIVNKPRAGEGGGSIIGVDRYFVAVGI